MSRDYFWVQKYQLKFTKKLYTVPTHNKHIFVRLKKRCAYYGKSAYYEKSAYLGKSAYFGKWTISHGIDIDYTI